MEQILECGSSDAAGLVPGHIPTQASQGLEGVLRSSDQPPTFDSGKPPPAGQSSVNSRQSLPELGLSGPSHTPPAKQLAAAAAVAAALATAVVAAVRSPVPALTNHVIEHSHREHEVFYNERVEYIPDIIGGGEYLDEDDF